METPYILYKDLPFRDFLEILIESGFEIFEGHSSKRVLETKLFTNFEDKVPKFYTIKKKGYANIARVYFDGKSKINFKNIREIFYFPSFGFENEVQVFELFDNHPDKFI